MRIVDQVRRHDFMIDSYLERSRPVSQPATLLAMMGAPLAPAPLDRASLIVIDAQEEYRSGRLPLSGVNEAVTELARLVELARAKDVPVFHVLHRVSEDAPIFNPRLPGYAEMVEIAPRENEAIVVKTAPNAFAGTDLAERIAATGRSEIIVAGFQTHMCVSSTVRAALDLGLRSTVVANACATRELPSVNGRSLSAAEVHAAALAALADAFAVVVPDSSAWR